MSELLFLTKEAPKQPFEVKAGLVFTPATEAEMKAIGEDLPDGYVAGWASTTDLDHYHHVVEKGAFQEAITNKGLTGPKGIKFLMGHDRDKVAGIIKRLEYRGNNLWIEAQMNLQVSYVKDLYEVTKMNGGLSFSVGFFLQDYAYKEDKQHNEYMYITKGDLFEVSVVPFAGNEECVMQYVKSREALTPPSTLAEFEKALVAKGFCKNRSEANKLTLLVKENFKLFKSKKDEPEPPAPLPSVSPVDATSLNEIAKHLAQIKSILTKA